jgi:hypothetical protein
MAGVTGTIFWTPWARICDPDTDEFLGVTCMAIWRARDTGKIAYSPVSIDAGTLDHIGAFADGATSLHFLETLRQGAVDSLGELGCHETVPPIPTPPLLPT